MATTFERRETLGYLQYKVAFELQNAILMMNDDKLTMAQVLEIARQGLKTAAEEAIEAVRRPPPTPEDRRESEAYADIVDTFREDVEFKARRFLTGL